MVLSSNWDNIGAFIEGMPSSSSPSRCDCNETAEKKKSCVIEAQIISGVEMGGAVSAVATADAVSASLVEEEGNNNDKMSNGVDDDNSTEVGCISPSSTCSDNVSNSVADAMSKADLKKTKGNELFKKGDFIGAITHYTAAIEVCESACSSTPDSDTPDKDKEALKISNDSISNGPTSPPLSESTALASYYSNRAFCHIKMENFGLAIIDSEKVMGLQPRNPKGFYRRGCAYLCLMKYKNALKDFQTVCQLVKDPNAERCLKECQRQVRQERFAAAISVENAPKTSEIVKLENFVVDMARYKGPVYDVNTLSSKFLVDLLEYIKVPGNTLHAKFAYMIVLDMIKQLQKLPTLVRINIGDKNSDKLTVCGDTHGQFYDLLNIFEMNGLPSEENPYLFNGDYVDRGSFSIEVILSLFAAKLIYPQHVHLVRGNHESKSLNKFYGFMGEVVHKYDEQLYDLFCECFCLLPLAHLINDKIFVVHGGLFKKDGVLLSDIEKIDRNREPPDDGLMADMLWSDPQAENGRVPSKRGVSCNFGPDVTASFLKDNNLDMVIRSHEMEWQGYAEAHKGKMITVFSAPNYCDSMGNLGAYIILNKTLRPKYVTFQQSPHPEVKAMKYASPLLNLM